MKRQVAMCLLVTLNILSSMTGGCVVSTPQPPTVTPVPSTATPPTITPTSTLEIVTIDPSILHITYICNDGFIIATAGKKILIDALFHDSQYICQADSDETAQAAQPPFDNADLILISHSHWDHFNPQIVGSYLQNNPQAILIAEKSAAEALSKEFTSFELVQERVQSVELARRQTSQMSFSGIDIEIISAPADVPNLGFLIRVGKFTIFHSGDSGLDSEMAADFQAYQLYEKGINLAFLPHWYFTDLLGQSILEEIHAENYIPMHYAGGNLEEVFAGITKYYPQAILFPKEWQTWSQ